MALSMQNIFNAKTQGRKGAKFRILFSTLAARLLVSSVLNPQLSYIRLAPFRLRAFAFYPFCIVRA